MKRSDLCVVGNEIRINDQYSPSYESWPVLITVNLDELNREYPQEFMTKILHSIVTES